MVPAMDSITIATFQEKGIDSVVDWFERHQQSFYALGWFYLRSQQQMEELFYRSIVKVHKELPRYKQDISFELWVASIFIDICRELSADHVKLASGESASHQDLFNALDQLPQEEKEAMVLTYGTGFSQEAAAHILRVPADKIKELLFSGTQSVRRHLYGTSFNGCGEYLKNYIDYLEKTMERPEKIEFEIHIYECAECQEDLAAFQDVTLMLHHAEWMNDLAVPEHLIANIKERLAEKENHRKQKIKKRKNVALVFASVFAFVIGIAFFTGAFANVYYGWTEENEQLRAFLQQDLGERMNLEAESDGVKIRIKGVVADDYQTLVFYEIEDTNEDKQYVMNFEDGLYIENDNELMKHDIYPRYHPPDLKAEMNKKNKNVYHGMVALRPLEKDSGVIKLNVKRIQELALDENEPRMGFSYRSSGFKPGDWKFEVPVTKQPSIEYELNEKAEIEGIQIRLDKLIMAPTATLLEYGIPMDGQEKRVDRIHFGDLEVNNVKVKPDEFGGGYNYLQPEPNWQILQMYYDPLLGEDPKDITVQFQSAYFSIENHKSVELDANQQYPQTFEYAGSTLSIDKVEVGHPTTVVISNHEVNNREFERLHLNVVGEDEHEPISIGIETEGVIVDKNGVQYDMNSPTFDYEKIDQPRHFVTDHILLLDGDKVIPKRIDLYGYSSMKYLDDVVKISLD
jgi:DNA-directed RNA polymerase specialized sigma24 family protein